MTKMAQMPIYAKQPLKSSSPEQKGQWPWGLCSIGDMGPIKFENIISFGGLFYGKVKCFYIDSYRLNFKDLLV